MAGLWGNRGFWAYLGSTAFSANAFAMQQLLVSWLLVGILLLPADTVGVVQAVIGLPGILLMLWGGASADRTDARSLLLRVYGAAWLAPLGLVAAVERGWLNIWSVTFFGIALGTALAFSSPAQQALLNRAAGDDIQRGVTLATAVGFIVQITGLLLAGQMEVIGLSQVLLIQAASLLLGAATIGLIAAAPPAGPREAQSTLANVLAGLQATYANKTIFNTLVVTFVSSIFNAGAFMTVLPFIVKRVYDGDAISLATIMIVFYAGATISNAVQFRIMPLARPGFWFLLMQVTRMVIIGLILLQPDWWLLMLVLFAWGLNMGVTTTLSRAIIQEAAAPAYLARILSVYGLGLLGTMPLGALALGFVIEGFGTLNALVPAVVVSGLLGVYGFVWTGLAGYVSPGVGRRG